jgi:diguanylate cyclase (GGDEF)-like protein
VAARRPKPAGSPARQPDTAKSATLPDLTDAASAEIARLRRELEEARARIAQLESLVDEDALIPVANRRAFVRELGRTIAFAERYGFPSSVLYFDVDNLKQINDRYGHPAGDAVLCLVAAVLLENTRTSDLVGRLGGDEFGVILVRTTREQAERKAAALAAAIAAAPLRWSGMAIPISASYGLYTFVGKDDPQVALDAADQAMYRQKRRNVAEPPPGGARVKKAPGGSRS